MAIKHSIGLRVLDEDGNLIRDNTYWEEDIERIGGVGAIVESLEPLCREGESIEIHPMYHE